jgi:hypothetical protein
MDINPIILAVLHNLYESKVITAKEFIAAVSNVFDKPRSIVPFAEQHRRLMEQAKKETENEK